MQTRQETQSHDKTRQENTRQNKTKQDKTKSTDLFKTPLAPLVPFLSRLLRALHCLL
jgi:hypothetical protein